MESLSVLNIKGENVGKISLNELVWGIEPNDAVLYDAITLARNNSRQGTASTKTRSFRLAKPRFIQAACLRPCQIRRQHQIHPKVGKCFLRQQNLTSCFLLDIQ